MIPRRRDLPLFAAGAATLAVVAAQAVRLPSPLLDAASGRLSEAARLELPALYVWTTPFSSLADMLTFQSARQHVVFLAYLLLGYWALRLARGRRPSVGPWLGALKTAGGYALYLALWAGFLAWACLGPRPLARLRPSDGDVLAVDFHSHTNDSWDAHRAFSPEENARWHKACGYDAAFITDHNRLEASLRARDRSRRLWRSEGYRSLGGEEASLQNTHVVVLGAETLIESAPYDGSLEGVRRFLQEVPGRTQTLAVLSLPEYWRHHWERLETVAGWGAAGIEIVNAAPKALDFPIHARARAVDLARRRGLFLAGASDNHGWAKAAYVWNLIRVPGHADMDPDQLQAAVLAELKGKGFSAVRVITRLKREPAEGLSLAADPLLGFWTQMRTWTWAQALACLLWIWGLALPLWLRRRRPSP